MSSYAIYRLPHGRHIVKITQTTGIPEELHSYRELNGRSGFVFAPFCISESCPVLLIRPDLTETMEAPDCRQTQTSYAPPRHTDEDERNIYATDFAAFHESLQKGEFEKLVLARSSRVECTTPTQPEELFMRACRLYPRMFVALVSTPQGGTWLMATPEILLSGDAPIFSTMALAGTMRLDDSQLGFDTPGSAQCDTPIEWDDKNTREQAYVASYIRDRIGRFAYNISSKGPYTARAGRLVHLRTDFTFTLDDMNILGDVIDSLHPTPAVCGIPKDEARDFIMSNESAGRSYYSGFSGPLQPDGATRLFVSLRCMSICDNGYRLYAGGGLLRESDEQHEWEETECKMDTMRCVINND